MSNSATILRRLSPLLLLLLLTSSARAQEWTIFDHESVEADTTFWFDYFNTGETIRPPGTPNSPYLDILLWNTDAQKGQGAMMVDWGLYASEAWGGSNALTHFDSTRFYDFSDFTHIGLYFKNLVEPAEQTAMRLKIHEGSGAEGNAATPPSSVAEGEDWYAESVDVYNDIRNQWTLVSFPLEDLGNNGCCTTAGYHRPGWSGVEGNNQFDLDKIFGFSLEWVTATLGTPNATVEGTVVWDNLHVRGERYNVLESFDDLAARNAVEPLTRWGTGASTFTFNDLAAAHAIQGMGAVEIPWSVHASESWGGGANWEVTMPAGTYYDDMAQRTHLSLFYDIVEQASTAGNVNLRVVLLENSEGQTEEWVYEKAGFYDAVTGGWTRLLMPLVGREGGDPNDQGFVIPPWNGYKGNNRLDTDKIFGYRIEWSAPASASGTTTTGTVRFDRLTGYGWQETDFQAPAAVASLSATSGEFFNTVTWTDVDGETGETYDIYYSAAPITSLDDPNVLVAAQRVAEGTETFVHDLYAPLTNQQVSYYYAIVATDAAGNMDPEALTATQMAVANTAQGVGTIALSAPTGFAADGQINEWGNVTPIRVEPGGVFGYVPASTGLVTDAADLSADLYVAAGDDALYVAFDVTDDRVVPVPAGVTTDRWNFDGTELYIGFFDSKGLKSSSYQTGEEAHYKFQFYTEVARQDQEGGRDIATAGDGNYSFTLKSGGGGYIIEARLPYESILFEGAPAFQPEQGWMVPFDAVVMDNDNVNPNLASREGILTFSPYNNDNSWQTPMNWFWAYTGTELRSVNVEEGGVGNRFYLAQNAPNPFRSSTRIVYEIQQAEQVSLTVYNVLGQRVATLVNGMQPAGTHEVTFNAEGLSAGVYIYRVRAGAFNESRSMTIVR